MTVSKQENKNNWKIRLFLILAPFICLVAKLICRTYRVTIVGKEHEESLNQGKPTLFVSWHQGILYYVYHFRNRNGIVMVSKSKDGELIDKMAKLLGFQTARGSSSRDGKEAMNYMIKVIQETHCSGGLTADAPRGPFGIAKMGIIKIAKETGLPLIPVMFWAKNKLQLKNWDKTILPLPFTKIVFFYAAPIFIQPDITPEQMEQERIQLSEKLNNMHKEACEYFDKKK